MSSTLIPANGSFAVSAAAVANGLPREILKPLERDFVYTLLAITSMGFLATMLKPMSSLKLI